MRLPIGEFRPHIASLYNRIISSSFCDSLATQTATVFHCFGSHGNDHVVGNPIVAQSADAAKAIQLEYPLDRGIRCEIYVHRDSKMFESVWHDGGVEAHHRWQKYSVGRPTMFSASDVRK